VDTVESPAPRIRTVVLLGSTGSIGTQVLEVVAASPNRFRVVAVAAGGADLPALARQAIAHRVSFVGLADPSRSEQLAALIHAGWPRADAPPQLVCGAEAATELAMLDCDLVLNGIAGAQGLPATLAALRAGHAVGLANKESLIAGGPLVLSAAGPGQLIAVDSEHSAMAQCLRAGRAGEVKKLILTASGGPFRGRSRTELRDVTMEQAQQHPTWAMGPLITTNSATLVNKGLELIEAQLLFGVGYDAIQAVVHPQSVVHSMVEFVDGSTLAQASPPDMRLPIALALGWPERLPDAAAPIDWSVGHEWSFEPVDNLTFPAVELARAAGRAGGCAPAVYNAANEAMVAAFHQGRCGFLDIADSIGVVLQRWLDEEHHAAGDPRDLSDVRQSQDWAARAVQTLASRR
jgi:1-deoxy-D-xylulose-5-phosphate reductoisomerase